MHVEEEGLLLGEITDHRPCAPLSEPPQARKLVERSGNRDVDEVEQRCLCSVHLRCGDSPQGHSHVPDWALPSFRASRSILVLLGANPRLVTGIDSDMKPSRGRTVARL